MVTQNLLAISLFKRQLLFICALGVVLLKFLLTTPATPLTQAYQCGFFMSNKRIFDKKPLTIPELIQKLANKGLVIENDARTQKYLRDIGYYRLVGYGLAFEQYH